MDDLDELTLARARRGDPRAFGRLVERYQRPVHAVVGRILTGVASAAEVDELAQEAFLRVFRGLPGFESQGPGRLTKWVLTIAARLAIDERRRPRLPTSTIDPEAVVGLGPGAETAASQARLAQALVAALETLTPEQRAVFVLREFHDFDYGELAQAFDVDVGTIKSRLGRARAALRVLLAEERHASP